MSGPERSPWARWLAVASLVLAAAAFSFLNSRERVTLDVGFTTLYQISLVGLVFGSFLMGMIAMFLFGLRYDRRVRDALRDHSVRPVEDDLYPPDPHFEAPPETPHEAFPETPPDTPP